jgi:pimeloyl-ACP methyl ester carboxylesterase
LLEEPNRMPFVERPDNIRIHWEADGEGPLVVLAHHTLWSYPGVYRGLISDLASDHRVVVGDPRGCGRSDRQGPYDAPTDAQDLLGVVEAAGGGAVALGMGDGFNRTVRVAAVRPDLVSHVIAVGPAAAAVLPRSELKGSEVFAASESVVEMVLRLFDTDPRAALHSIIAAMNPELDADELRERVDRVAAYQSPEAARARISAWLEDDASTEARLLGNRLSILHAGTEPLYEGALGERVAALFPEARLEELPGGPISTPKVTAAWVRRLTRAAAGARDA